MPLATDTDRSIGSLDPVVTQWLNLAGAGIAQVGHYLNLLSQLSITGTDETETVSVTLKPNGGVEDVCFQPGCKQLGAGIINERLNRALQTSTAALEAAKAEIGEAHIRELTALMARNDYLDTAIGAGRPLTSAAEQSVPALCASTVTTANPAYSIFVTTRNGSVAQIAITPAALRAGPEADLAAEIVEVARFSYARDRAARADRLVAKVVALGGTEDECRQRLNLPIQDDIDTTSPMD
jgi:hypothetical protein